MSSVAGDLSAASFAIQSHATLEQKSVASRGFQQRKKQTDADKLFQHINRKSEKQTKGKERNTIL
jgi:hypothetical protein